MRAFFTNFLHVRAIVVEVSNFVNVTNVVVVVSKIEVCRPFAIYLDENNVHGLNALLRVWFLQNVNCVET